jgi:hypothetical protein
MTENEDVKMEKVLLDELVDSAQRIIIRMQVGLFINEGPQGNILSVESRVAFATTVNELYREGYEMVSPQEYAETYGITVERVYDMIRNEGSLFLLTYAEGEPPSEAVPLDEKRVTEDLGPHITG